jgi:signal transduction histidine kinase
VVVVASVTIGDHRSTVRTLARSMLSVVALAVVVLWLMVRASVRGALQELLALVGWTASVARSDEVLAPPAAHTEEVAKLSSAFDALVRRLFEALARERASSAHIAHELRTPLTAMVAELESLRLEDEVAAAAVARVQSDVSRLADVVDAILVLSTRQGPSPADGIVNVADLVRDLSPEGVRVNAPDEALVHGDERLLALAIRNLLENAQKHAGGADAVHVDRADYGVQIAVSDRGPGLDASARARMFDRYWRHGDEVEGRGLGLALVRAVAERHAGAARAEPGPGGKGLTVFMTVSGLVGWHEVSRRSLSDR